MEKQGKIYTIKSHQTELVYIGSTFQELPDRLYKHEFDNKRYINGTFGFVSSFDILQYNDYYIELLEDYPCQNRKQLTKREGELIRQNNNCVNKKIEGRTRKEWIEDNKEQIKQKKKEYREKNKEQIKQQKKEYYEKNKEKRKRQI